MPSNVVLPLIHPYSPLPIPHTITEHICALKSNYPSHYLRPNYYPRTFKNYRVEDLFTHSPIQQIFFWHLLCDSTIPAVEHIAANKAKSLPSENFRGQQCTLAPEGMKEGKCLLSKCLNLWHLSLSLYILPRIRGRKW